MLSMPSTTSRKVSAPSEARISVNVAGIVIVCFSPDASAMPMRQIGDQGPALAVIMGRRA
jgi:hypothetical protein